MVEKVRDEDEKGVLGGFWVFGFGGGGGNGGVGGVGGGEELEEVWEGGKLEGVIKWFGGDVFGGCWFLFFWWGIEWGFGWVC